MSKIKESLTKIPMWTPTLLTAVLILWLTLAPDPLGDDTPTLFPGADKVVHGIMFGFLTVMILFDIMRKRGWNPVTPAAAASAALVSSVSGVAIEFAQRAMAMGRGFETSDMIADMTGASICAVGWLLTQHYWSDNNIS